MSSAALGLRVVRLEREQQRIALVERIAEGAEVGLDAGDEPVLLHQPLLEPARVAGGEHLGEQHVGQEGREIGDRVGHPVAGGEGGLRGQRVGFVAAPLAVGRRLAEVGPVRHRRAPARRRSASR